MKKSLSALVLGLAITCQTSCYTIKKTEYTSLAASVETQRIHPDLLLLDEKGFSLHRKNVEYLDDAQIVLIGDIHTVTTENIDFLLGEFVEKDDYVLIEQPFDNFKHMNLPQIGQRISQQDLEGLALKHKLDPKSYLSSLILKKKGIVKGVDCSFKLRLQGLYQSVWNSFFVYAKEKLSNNQELHPFAQWLFYEDLELTDNKEELLEKIKDYEEQLPSRKELNNQRQQQIIDNVVREARSKQRCYVVLGASHIDDSLIERLEQEGLHYASFMPSTDLNLSKIFSYFVSLLDEYIDCRIMYSNGKSVYVEGFDGLAEDLTQTIGKYVAKD